MAYSGGGGGGAGGGGSRGGGYLKITAKNLIELSGNLYTYGGTGTGGDGTAGGTGGYYGNCGGTGGTGGAAAINANSSGGAGGAKDPVCAKSSIGGAGGAGGNGAGGGICLISHGPLGIKFSGTLDTRGGGGDMVNCGSPKLIGVKGQIDISSATILGGWNDSSAPYIGETKNWMHVC